MGIKPKGYVYLSRKLTFSAAHRLHHPDQDDSLYGKCANLHGHNYVVEVMVQGKVDPETGFVVDLKDLRDLMRDKIERILDHKNLDSDVAYFNKRVQSAENICIFIWHSLENEIPSGARLYRVRLYETEKNMVDFYG